MVENLPKLMLDTIPQIQVVQRATISITKKKKKIHTEAYHPNFRQLKTENLERSEREKVFYVQRKKDNKYSGLLIRNQPARRAWDKIFKVLKETDYQPRTLLLAKQSFSLKEK